MMKAYLSITYFIIVLSIYIEMLTITRLILLFLEKTLGLYDQLLIMQRHSEIKVFHKEIEPQTSSQVPTATSGSSVLWVLWLRDLLWCRDSLSLRSSSRMEHTG